MEFICYLVCINEGKVVLATLPLRYELVQRFNGRSDHGLYDGVDSGLGPVRRCLVHVLLTDVAGDDLAARLVLWQGQCRREGARPGEDADVQDVLYRQRSG